MGSRRINLLKPAFLVGTISANEDSAIETMWRVRSTKPRISLPQNAIGRPICQDISSLICSCLDSKYNTMRSQILARSAREVSRHSFCAILDDSIDFWMS